MRSAIVATLVASVASDECAENWGQCGGTKWTGPTCCQSGSACVTSHCLPVTAVVDLPLGSVRGFDRNMSNQLVSTFWSIPFAKPPTGERRFHYPEAFDEAWSNVRNAYTKPVMCSQGPGLGDEDCLYLNVYAPRSSLQCLPEERLPVMFWIFGGGYSAGDGYELGEYDGSILVNKHDVVLVSGNYRLNTLGFNTYTQGPHGETGNQAMADQRMSMQWTQDNVHLFGGDPTSVTIFGESAGAFSVMYHTVSPPSWPLFSKAIMESPTSSLSWFFQPKAGAEETCQGWAEAVGCPAGEGQLSCLQAVPAVDMVKPPASYAGLSPLFHLMPSGPVVDGTLYGLLDVPSKLAEQGRFAQVPLMVGANKNGGSIFEPLVSVAVPGFKKLEAASAADASTMLNWFFDAEDYSKIIQTYPIEEFSAAKKPYQQQVAQILRDVVFQCSDRRIANAWASHNAPVYLYTFSFDFGPVLNDLIKVKDFHGSEIPFVFGHDLGLFEKFPLVTDVQKMSDVMSCQWASFAHTGSPNAPLAGPAVPGCESVHGHVKKWPLFAEGREYYSLKYSTFHRPSAVALQANNTYPSEFPSDARCDMWDTVTYPWHSSSESTMIVV